MKTSHTLRQRLNTFNGSLYNLNTTLKADLIEFSGNALEEMLTPFLTREELKSTIPFGDLLYLS